MKTRLIIISFMSLVLIVMTSYSAQASKGDYTKPYKKEFNINKGATLLINSEFTDIKAYNWEKDVISIEVTVSVDARNEDKANDKFRKVTVDMSGSSNLVSLTTGFNNNFSNNGNNHLDIEAIIYYPSHIQLDLENEFGSCVFENIDGTAQIEMSYGDFDAQNLNHGDLDIEMEFGTARVQKFQAGKVEVSYGGFEAQYVGMLNLNSEFSAIDIEEINQIEVETSYDKFYVGNCNVAFVDSEFSGLRIDEIEKSLDMEISYGSFNLKSIKPDFDMIHIDSEFTGITLYFEQPLNFAFKADADMGDFKYPQELASITYIDKEMMELSLKGYFGNAKGEAPKLIISLENANASVKIKE